MDEDGAAAHFAEQDALGVFVQEADVGERHGILVPKDEPQGDVGEARGGNSDYQAHRLTEDHDIFAILSDGSDLTNLITSPGQDVILTRSLIGLN